MEKRLQIGMSMNTPRVGFDVGTRGNGFDVGARGAGSDVGACGCGLGFRASVVETDEEFGAGVVSVPNIHDIGL